MELLHRTGPELTPAELYALLRLRTEVFVVEQACPYQELDGRDLEPGTDHLWLADGAGVAAGIRILTEPDPAGDPHGPDARDRVRADQEAGDRDRVRADREAGDRDGRTRRIGRVVTRVDQRGRGLSSLLLTETLALTGPAPTVLDAQSHLRTFYERFGFSVAGPEFVEDGIPHLPMARLGDVERHRH